MKLQKQNELVILACLAILLVTSLWSLALQFNQTASSEFTNSLGRQGQTQEQPASQPTGQPADQSTRLTEILSQPTVTSTPTPTPTPTLEPIPQSKIITGGRQVFQTFNNCGPAAFSMTLSYFGQDVSQQTLGQQLRPYQNPQGNNDDKSVTLQEVAAKAEDYGLVAYHRPAGNIRIIQQFVANNIPVIARTWLEPNEDIGHYRVVKGYDRTTNELIQDDSLQGANLRYSNEDFLQLWRDFNYEFLVLVPESRVELAERILAVEGLEDRQAAWSKALAMANETLVDQPNNTFAQFNRSVALYYLGQYQQSVEAYEAVAAELPSRTLWYQIEPIKAYYQAGHNQQLLAITERILNNHNRAFSELYYLRAQVFEQQGNQPAADEAMQRAELYNSSGSWRENVE